MDNKLIEAATLIRNAKHIAVLTGAGMSAESGIPTFRDALTGLWANFDAERLATADAFRRDKELVWGWYEWRRMKVLKTQPNAGHVAIAKLAKLKQISIVTQNVDDLHERAGSTEVLHVHGSLHHPWCFSCSRPTEYPPEIPEEPEGGRKLMPPKCEHCGGYIRPGIVWFGESLPQDIWQQSVKAINQCEVLLVIGTSGLVYPAAGLPEMARAAGKQVIVINPNLSE